MRRCICRLGGVGLAVLLLSCGWASAVTVVWDVDPSASYVRLTVPDQVVVAPNIGNVTVRLRDADSTSNWTDAGGRRAFLDGSITTDYVNFTSLEFLGGFESIVALEQTNLRPNPGQWDAASASYTGTSTAVAALGARIRGTYILTFDVAFLAMRGVHLDIESAVLPLSTTGAFDGGLSMFGITTALADTDGLSLPLNLGQPVPDLRAEPLPPTVATNTGGGTVDNLGGRNRKLTYTINEPVTIQVETIVISGTATGQIVAYATIPDLHIPFDADSDGDVDKDDFNVFKACVTGPSVTGRPTACTAAQFTACDRDGDNDVDERDFGKFQRCYSGANKPALPTCAQ